VGFMEGTVLAHMGIQEVKFLAPVHVGDTLHAESKVVGKRLLKEGDRGIIMTETTGLNQRGEEVIRSKDAVLFKTRAAGIG